jgi:glycosyltransferase involved in cell wall biosynthesis
MRIAQVAPLAESVPPQLYGGTERVVSFLTEELVRLGHHVTLFASGDSRTSSSLVAVYPRALRLSGCRDHVAPHVAMLEQVARRSTEFDIVHFHIAPFHFPVVRRVPRLRHVTTLHGRLDLEEYAPLYREFTDMPLVSISQAQRGPLREACWIGTVHHGLPAGMFEFNPSPQDYLAFLGRISPEKRVDRAIAIATRCGCRLRIAAKVDPADREYFDREIQPLLAHPLVEYIGEIGDDRKNEFLGGAKGLLFPIDWPEPFGLVMIESLACGTPVVAYRGGSVEEIIEHGATGFVVDSIPEAIEAVRHLEHIDRRACRDAFERRFSVERMARDYLELYRRLAAREPMRVA